MVQIPSAKKQKCNNQRDANLGHRSKARAFPRNFRGAGRPGRGARAHFLVYVPPSKRAKASERQAMAGVCRNHRIRIQSRRVGRRPRIARGLIGARRLCRRPCGFRHRPGPPQPWDERRRCAGSRREEADDAELLAEALANEPVMLTNDRDFLVLASRRNAKGSHLSTLGRNRGVRLAKWCAKSSARPPRRITAPPVLASISCNGWSRTR